MIWLKSNWKSLFMLASVAFILFIGFRLGEGRVHKQWDAERLVQARELAEQKDKVIVIERQAAENLAQKQKELENEKKQTEIAIADADTELNRLQNTIAAIKSKLPASTSGTSVSDGKAIAGSWDALENCSKEYTEMGKIADRQRDDLAGWQAYGKTIDEFREAVNVKDTLF